MSPIDIAFGVGILLSIGVYFGAVSHLRKHLRQVYTTTWVNLGDPFDRSPNPTLGDLIERAQRSDRMVGFIWSNQYKSVHDRRLAQL